MTEIIEFIAWVVRKTFWSFAVFVAFIAHALSVSAKFLLWRLFDVFCLFFHVVACCTIVRLPSMILLYTETSAQRDWTTKRLFGFTQTLIFLMDVPIACSAVFVFATLIRYRNMLEELSQPEVINNLKQQWRIEKKKDIFSKNDKTKRIFRHGTPAIYNCRKCR